MTKPQALLAETWPVVPFPEARTVAEIELAAVSCWICSADRVAQCSSRRECQSDNPRGKPTRSAVACVRAARLAGLLEQGECLKRAAFAIGVTERTCERYRQQRAG
jgi:hypothetical protein